MHMRADDPVRRRRRAELTVLLAMYAGYASFMLCRNTLSASSAAMIDDPSLGLDLAEYGRIVSWNSLGAIAGKLVTGVGADKVGGRRMFLLALGLTAASTAAFGFASGFFLFALLNFMGQFFKAGAWPAMTKIVGAWYPARRHGTIWSIISTSSRAGTIGAGALLGWLLLTISWRHVFVVSASIAGAMMVMVALFLRDRPADVGLSPPSVLPTAAGADHDDPKRSGAAVAAEADGTTHPFAQLGAPAALGAFCLSPRFWFAGMAVVFLTMMMDIIYFLPSYLHDTLGLESGAAAMAGSAFPVGAFCTLLVAGPIYDRLSKRSHVFVLGGMLGVAVLCVLCLLQLPAWDLGEAAATSMAMGILFAFGVTLSPAYYIPASVFSIAFGGKHSGFLVSLLDVFGYAGAFVFIRFGAGIAEEHGWTVFLQVLLGVSVLATLFTSVFLWLEFRATASTPVEDRSR